jgi:hypothetical protein
VARTEPEYSDRPSATLSLVRLVGSVPQALLSVFTGGAHCCVRTKIATRASSGAWRILDAESKDGDVGFSFEDLDGDGESEMLSGDNRFLYAFGSYAGSTMPAKIDKIINGSIVDVTREPKYLRYHRQYLAALEDGTDRDSWRSNEFLAGWVAQKILLGEGAEAWATMLRNYDRRNDAGLTECTVPLQNDGQCPGGKELRHTFPVALRKFLDDGGYR